MDEGHDSARQEQRLLSPPSEEMRPLASEEFRDVIGHFASGVTVITAVHDGARLGTTASAVSSLSLEPPMLLICMNQASATGRAIASSGRFAVNILSEEQPEVALRFARQGGDFDGISVETGSFGEPLLADALATLECRVTEEVTGGSHVVFVASVDRAGARLGVAPLAYFRGEFGRLELGHDETALSEIRALVVTGDLAAGIPIDLVELADRLQILRGSAYHALGKLVGEGLIERENGAFAVVPMTLARFEDALACQLAIELGVIQQTIGKVDRGQLDELRATLEQAEIGDLDRAGAGADIVPFQEFRLRFVSLASPSLAHFYEKMTATAMIAMGTAVSTAGPIAAREANVATMRACKQLVRAYEEEDLEAAQETVETQVAIIRRLTKESIEVG